MASGPKSKVPKSKKKRRKAKKKEAARPEAQSEQAEPRDKALTKLLRVLYRDDAQGLQRLIRFAPLFTGAWLASGMVIENVFLFIVVSAAVLLAYFSAHPETRKEFVFSEILELILLAVLAALLLGLYALSNSASYMLLGCGAVLLIWISEKLAPETPRAIILLAFERVVEMSLLAILSVYSQQIPMGTNFHWEYTVLGFVPGSCLAAAIIAQHLEVFASAGWGRSKIHARTKKQRPALLTQTYTLFLTFGPAIPVILVPLMIFPSPFLLLVLAFWPIPKLCHSFLEASIDDRLQYLKTLNLSALLSLGVVVAALAARYMG